MQTNNHLVMSLLYAVASAVFFSIALFKSDAFYESSWQYNVPTADNKLSASILLLGGGGVLLFLAIDEFFKWRGAEGILTSLSKTKFIHKLLGALSAIRGRLM